MLAALRNQTFTVNIDVLKVMKSILLKKTGF